MYLSGRMLVSSMCKVLGLISSTVKKEKEGRKGGREEERERGEG
jgi:hypothetical protein